ncbi:heavy metal translocating P-type ATPase [Teichococcus oryzae]|uniref:Copper-translocating P-type ATPase n=1 Tax=Teichococcus oryzae TaxID=1608942 RepID=A0A5B2TJ31_9PROT|nr:copper-translocating P-type ATPase [Pseudoroseomonas oryzae]KAA2213995.1 copper-translocating P-type ATPase [Pseudoroseomonas oryzae]
MTTLTLDPPAVTGSCDHCGAASIPGSRFCCTGCEGAHALVRGLGLDAFYARRDTADGTLRPAAAAPVAYAPLARALSGGRHRLELMVAGLTCGACVWLVEQALAAEPDVRSARAALSTRRLTITWDGPATRADALAALVARLGFRVVPFSPACLRAAEDAEGRELARALGIAAFGAMNVMLVSVAVWVGVDMGEGTRAALHWLAALIGLPTVLVAGRPLYRRAWEGLRAGRINMDFAVSLGVLATTAMSLSETLRNGEYTWFDGATALLALLLAGRLLDRGARRRARQAAAELLALQQGMVTRLTPGGREMVAVEAVRPGDRILVAAGERLRLDGWLEEASASLDASAVTGESLPRAFQSGDALPAGAVNMGAPLTLRVTHAVPDGSLAGLTRALEGAEQARGRFRSIADKAAAFYVPVVHAVAALTFLGWWLGVGVSWQAALVPAVAALIITCPCGLAIAVPAVQVVAAGALFRRGVLVATPNALERLSGVDHVVLDKTGTVTEGRPALLPGDWTEADLDEAACLAAASRHPLCRALAAARPGAAPARDVVEFPGRGLACGAARLGSATFLGLPADGTGLTLWWRAAPDQPAVAFRFADRLRPDAAVAVASLRQLGLTVELLSGDAHPAVAAVAAQLGIDEWRAGVTPEGKAARLAALRQAGRRPLMVGDGINDMAALAMAAASAVPEDATDSAACAADLVLRGGPGALPEAVRIARRAQRAARQNIAFSLSYNVVAVPTAILGFCTPLIAALVMASSSLIVIGNALRVGGRGPAS